jgi:glyoxylase-like metal-dependent hydrolase (beta-lactamase superfamily II)
MPEGAGATPVWTVANGVFPSNCYLCATDVANECFIVDPGLDPAPIEAALGAHGLIPRAVLCTHGHFDHAGSAAHFRTRHDCPVYLHARDVKTLRSSNFLLMAFKIPARVTVPDVVAVDDDNAVVTIGGCRVRFHPTPGHTPGSCLIELRGTVFTGDTIYSRGVGLSRLPGEDADQLRRSILSVWDRFPDDMIVRPGHGDASTFGDLKRGNEALLRFLRAEPSPTSAS